VSRGLNSIYWEWEKGVVLLEVRHIDGKWKISSLCHPSWWNSVSKWLTEQNSFDRGLLGKKRDILWRMSHYCIHRYWNWNWLICSKNILLFSINHEEKFTNYISVLIFFSRQSLPFHLVTHNIEDSDNWMMYFFSEILVSATHYPIFI
jgi:hypothetical protein